MNQFIKTLTVLGLLVIWIDIDNVEGRHAQITPKNSNFGRRVKRQIMLSNQTQPPPAPGPAGYVYKVQNCKCQATRQYSPVCGNNGVTYQNRQLLQCAASCGETVTFRRPGPCGVGLMSAIERPSANT